MSASSLSSFHHCSEESTALAPAVAEGSWWRDVKPSSAAPFTIVGHESNLNVHQQRREAVVHIYNQILTQP